MAAEEHVIDIVVQTHDKVSEGINKAKSSLRSFDASIERTRAQLQKMARQDYNVVLKAIDQITPVGSRAQNTLRAFAGRTYSTTLRAIDRTADKLREVRARLTSLTSKAWAVTVTAKQKLGDKVGGAANSAFQSVTGMGAQMAAGAGIGYGIYDTIKTYEDFQAQMSKVAAISGASGQELEMLTAKAKEMGATTQFSATEAGQAFEYMAMAGWKTNDMMSGISGIMNLAAASGEDLASVSDIVTDALTAFGLQASDSAHFADVLAAASSNSNTNVGMMGNTFKYAAPLAGALGYSVEDVAVAIGLMANAGIKGEMAGTALRSTMTRLVDPPKEAAQALDQLGISVKNSDGSVKPFMQTMEELRDRFGGLSDSEKAQMASSIAGQEAMSGFLAIVNASEGDFEKLCAAIDNADGASARMAETMNDNLKGDLKALSSVWEAFQLEIMSGKGGDGIRNFVQGAKEDIEKFTSYIKDGFDISDVGRLALDILNQLKNKFLEFDGIGSILAGGVLAGGLYKIISLAKKATDAIGEITKGGVGSGAAKAAGEAATSVKSMVVNATNVVINGGKGGAAADAAAEAAGAAGGGGKAAPKGKGGRFSGVGRMGKLAGRLALPLTVAAGLYDVATAEEGERANAAGGAAGGVLGGVAGAKAGALAGGAIGSVVPGVGTAAGAAIGGLAGGIGGAMLGTDLGQSLVESFQEAWPTIVEGASEAVQAVEDAWNGFTEAAAEFFSPLVETVEDFINVLVGIGAVIGEELQPYFEEFSEFAAGVWAGITEAASAAWDFLAGVWGAVADWFISTVWQPIADFASEAWALISSVVGAAWDFVAALWGAAAGWFDSVVWQPISSAVQGVYNSIVDAFNNAIATVKGAWGSVASWFESNVIGPIREKFNTLRSIGSSITGLAGSGGGDAPHAAGGIFFAPHRGLVAEDGPEAIVPLSDPVRGYDILRRAADMMGVNIGDAAEGFTSDDGTDAVGTSLPMSVPTGGTSSAPSVTISMGGITISVDGGGMDAQGVVSAIREKMEDIADEVGGQMAEKIASIYGNQPVMNFQ